MYWMERVFFLAAHFVIFLTLWVGSVQRVKSEFRKEIVRSCIALATFPIIIFFLGWGMDTYVLTDKGDPKFLPTAASVVGLFGVGAAGVFFTMGFDYSESGYVLGSCALALSPIEFLLAVAHPQSIYKEILNVQAALTLTAAVAILSALKARIRLNPLTALKWIAAIYKSNKKTPAV